MEKFNLVKSLTRVINNIPALRGKVRMGLLCLSLATFGVNEAWGQTYNGGTWYSLYSTQSENAVGDGDFFSVNVFAPTTTNLWFQCKKYTKISTSGNAIVYQTTASGESEAGRYKYTKSDWETVTSIKTDKNVSKLRFVKKDGTGGSCRNPQLPMALHILCDNGTIYGTSSLDYDFDSTYLETASEGYQVKLRSFLTAGNITITSSDPTIFHVGSADNTDDFVYNVGANAFAYSGGNGTCSTGNAGQISNYNFAIYFTPLEAQEYTGIITITDGTSTATIAVSGVGKKNIPSMSWWSDEDPKTISIEDGPITNLVTDLPEGCDYNLSVSEDGYITIDNITKTITPTNPTPSETFITLTATVDNDYYYGQITKYIAVTDLKSQTIEWDQSFNNLKIGDAPITLTATAKTAITYQSSNTDVVTINGNTMNIVGKGTAYVVATAAADAEYAQAMAQKAVIVRNPGESCAPYEEGAGTFKNNNDFTFKWDFPTKTVTYTITKPTNVGALREATVQEYYGGSWHDIDIFRPSNSGTTHTKDVNINSRSIRVRSDADNNMTVNSIKVYMTQYLNLSTSSLSMTATTTSSVQNSFKVDYANIQGPLEYSSTNPYISFSPTSGTTGDCGEWGSATINVTYAPAEVQNGDYTIMVWDGKTESLKKTITVHCTSTASAQTMTWNQTFETYKTTETVPAFTATTDAVRTDENTYPIVYTSSDPNVASITGNQLTILSSGSVTVRASQDGKDANGRQRYTSVSVDKTITIEKVNPVVTFPTAKTITYGTALSNDLLIGGTASVSGSFAWVEVGQIKGAGTKAYNVTFTPDNIGWYNTITQPVTITINKADQIVTWDVASPIKVKKEDGDYTLTASSTSGRAITYTLSDPSLGTINGNVLTPLISGDCKITAICPEDGDYNASNSIEKNLFIAGPDEIIWKYKDGDHVWAGQNLNADGKLATAHTPVWFGINQTQGTYVIVENTTNPKTVYTAIASNDVLVEINGLTEGDEHYSQVSSAIHVYIDRCYQGLVWDQNFLTYLADEQGHIDETVDLTAYAVDSLNRETDLPIVYSVDNPAVAEIVGDATTGWKLHIKGAGSATLTASVAQTNIYQGVTETRKINVRKAGEPCGSYALISTGEKNFNQIKDNTYTFDKPGETLTFKTRKYSILTLNADVTVQGYNIVTRAWEHIDTYNLNNTDKSTKTYTIKEDFRAIKMFTGADIEDNYRYISDLYITQKEYIRSSVDKIDEKIYINQDFSKTFTVDYSDKPYISCTIDNDQLEILRDDDSNTCGEYGTITFTVKSKNIWLTPTTINGKITLSTSVGDNIIIIPVTIQVDLGGTYKFTNKLGDNDWNNLQNWDYGGSVPTSLPDIMNQILVQQPVRITNEVKVYELQVQTDATQGWDGSVTIAPTGGLTIYNGGAIGIDGKLTIESSREHTGYFRVVPDVVQKWVATPTATMQYASKGSLDSGANRDATWQYFGIPVKGADFTVDYITWMYEWSEPNGWIDLKSQSQPVHLKPFQGYAITQYGQPTYNFTGSLNMGEVDLHLTYTEGNGMWGDNMFANSYPSPIDVKLFTEEDVQDLDHRTIYLYNSGSWNQWNEGTQGGDWGHLINNGAPGTFTAIPILAATYLETEQTLIAPMQGMCIHTDQKTGATVHLDYAKHVWDAMPSGSKDDMNAPLLTPTRKKSSQKPEGVSDEAWENIQYAQARHDSIEEAHKQKVAELRHRVRLTVYGENSGVDHIYLLEKDGFTADYDNGYDAYKMFSDGLLNIYTSEDFGEMAVAATDKLEGTFIGINAGDGETYQLKVSSVIGDNLYLKDLLNGAEIPLQEGQMYMFNAVPKLKDAQRFVIIKRENQGVGTSLDGVMGGDAYIWTDNENVHIEQAAANTLVRLFSSDGKLITTTTVSGSGEINISTLPNNVYMVMLNEQTYKFVKK